MPHYEFTVAGTRFARVEAADEAEARAAIEQNAPDVVQWGVFDPQGDVTLTDVEV